MRFEEVLPALREGKKIRRSSEKNKDNCYFLEKEEIIHNYDKYRLVSVFKYEDLMSEDWEIIKETKKVKLRDLTAEQVKKWIDENCNRGDYCKDCPFRCIECYDTFWLSCKDMFSDKFLDQEVEIGED